MSSCTDVCEVVCDRLSGAGFDVPADSDLGPDGHDDVLGMLAWTVIIPARFTLPENARLLSYPNVEQLRVTVEDRIVELIADHVSADAAPGTADAHDLARMIFLEAAALLRPDLFDKAPQAIIADDEEE